MTYLVTESCIRCKYQDCVSVCPADCFYVGDAMLVIEPDECIDCGVCVPECPVDAIIADDEDENGFWLDVNTRFAREWPNITAPGDVPADADDWKDTPNKKAFLNLDG